MDDQFLSEEERKEPADTSDERRPELNKDTAAPEYDFLSAEERQELADKFDERWASIKREYEKAEAEVRRELCGEKPPPLPEPVPLTSAELERLGKMGPPLSEEDFLTEEERQALADTFDERRASFERMLEKDIAAFWREMGRSPPAPSNKRP